jgi:hypothetical protein
MISFVQDFRAAVQKTTSEAELLLGGQKKGLTGVYGITDGVLQQNIIVAENWRILLRDVQRVLGSYADREQNKSGDVALSSVKITP